MPFGFEQRQHEQIRMDGKLTRNTENKNFVEVNATMYTNGTIRPISLEWEGRHINIDRVLNVRPGVSLKDPTVGTRFECAIRNRRFYLYFTGIQWYMDS